MGRIGKWLAVFLLALLAAAAAIRAFAAPDAPDAFYRQPRPAAAKPGDLIASEAFARAVPAGARAMRILYATTRADGSPATASAIVMARAGLTQAKGVVAWAHGTSGIVAGCAPSVMADPFGYVPALAELLAQDWVYVATDYVGLGTQGGHAYLVGEEAARGVLDSVRAARRLAAFPSAERVVVWGHSQGGGSALWTAMRAAYAPDVSLAGAAALAPAGDLTTLLAGVRDTLFGRIVAAYALAAYARTYPDVSLAETVPTGAGWLVRDIAARCIVGWPTLVSVAQSLLVAPLGVLRGDPSEGALGRRMAQNTPRGPFPVPLLIAQGEADDLVLPAVQRGYASAVCASGATMAYRSYTGLDHLTLVAPASPLTRDLIAWTRARFEGAPAPGDCPIAAR
jgi:acetyl esterase/lipase